VQFILQHVLAKKFQTVLQFQSVLGTSIGPVILTGLGLIV